VAVQKWCSELMGLSLKNVRLRVEQDGKTVFSELGELMFTHFGLSGPLVLSASARLDGELSEYRLFIDTKPGLTEEQLDARLLRDFSDAKNRAFRNALDRLLPKRLIEAVVTQSGIGPYTQVNAVTRAQRARLVRLLKGIPVDPAALRPVEEAVVTRGGISTVEIDPKTMRSKLVPNLYFAGEVIDVDAYTGGFNLQIAFSTGYLCGKNI
jgi:predicted Rossmann fold flavoprotein